MEDGIYWVFYGTLLKDGVVVMRLGQINVHVYQGSVFSCNSTTHSYDPTVIS